jgi:hypothetical protein
MRLFSWDQAYRPQGLTDLKLKRGKRPDNLLKRMLRGKKLKLI